MRIELNKASKIVIKLGSSIIDNRDDMIINGICASITEFLKENKEVMLVTSGAISQGMKVMDVKNKPKDIKKLQSLAAVGQQKLMLKYEKIFSEHDFQTAQVLITHNDINDRVRYLNIKGTLEELLNNGVIPIINENDVVSTEEIKFGDNDNLASMIANLVDADLLIILTDQKGIYAMQIGDGFLVIHSPKKDYQLVFLPKKGEYQNETVFVTCDDAIASMQTTIIEGNYSFICASTDGLESVALKLPNYTPFAPFFQPLQEYIFQTQDPEKEETYLINFLKSERLNVRTNDDKTLLLALQKSCLI